MSRTLAGTLLLPNGQPAGGARIFLTAKRNELNSILQGMDAFFLTNSDGSYSQSVVNGYYSVSVEYVLSTSISNRRWHLGDINVDSGATISLNELLQFSEDPSSDIANQMQEWYEAVMAAVPEVEADKNAAQASATSAAGSATAAAGSATAAAGSATAANASAGSASTSATTATGAASTATTAAGTATTQATNAANSATAADASADRAEEAADSVDGVVAAAEAARDAAITAKGQAEPSAGNASTSATAASSSATAAAGSASTATTKAGEAATSATAASDAADTAIDKAGEAEASATASAGSATAAASSATNAADSAEEAGNEAGTAVAARDAAQGFATAAEGSATAAAASETAALNSANEAEADKQQAQTAATNAGNSSTDAYNSASAAEISATNAAGSETAAASSAANSASSATSSEDSAQESAQHATDAATAKTAAEAARDDAAIHQTNAESAASEAALWENIAMQFAQNDEDVPVVDGDGNPIGFSSKHYAAKAEEAAGGFGFSTVLSPLTNKNGAAFSNTSTVQQALQSIVNGGLGGLGVETLDAIDDLDKLYAVPVGKPFMITGASATANYLATLTSGQTYPYTVGNAATRDWMVKTIQNEYTGNPSGTIRRIVLVHSGQLSSSGPGSQNASMRKSIVIVRNVTTSAQFIGTEYLANQAGIPTALSSLILKGSSGASADVSSANLTITSVLSAGFRIVTVTGYVQVANAITAPQTVHTGWSSADTGSDISAYRPNGDIVAAYGASADNNDCAKLVLSWSNSTPSMAVSIWPAGNLGGDTLAINPGRYYFSFSYRGA